MKLPKIPKPTKLPNLSKVPQISFLRRFSNLIPLIGIATLMSGLIFVAVQQSYREAANDPQIQNAEEIADTLISSIQAPPPSPENKVDFSKSMSVFTIVYDASGNSIYSNAALDGNDPTLPRGVLDNAKKKGETRFTWKPKKGVRAATVIKHYSGQSTGYVLVGRSLKEVEKRELNLAIVVSVAWLSSIAFIFTSNHLLTRTPKPKKKKQSAVSSDLES
ncbi:TPA: hypothetical protein DDW69_01990 [candidate division CPR2 bacterium]|uniref:Uncharacterized protein n=1 Tax=candidate division CPR2 bacterium GW2011_GWC1_41_48 TaxID=1618344 RepID=A0A0G0W9W1_UNCC2|nr:MAG: hypothetical protein UT47_C0001G0199 [candidate division CPR2 bacterium GW2011_GWC2_39_35]KKR28148.1 MAG: hypothetical protein UT60_C0027G0038 [candidate division CPR2 bacterium GW2011_GWD2_39_7]KKS09794.1 MAG: hypothetical protein UU65_C0001G0199 [candidate division CPR2 bacterium GW2011_GWC1_41_48]OGB72264.1 MAG: hypothetical protein A2Y26_05345 [candidate division CPR2 bacterium GWD2_39_7]HBG81590.1 hypothetical protein [candidate division CPR2 bacterium]